MKEYLIAYKGNDGIINAGVWCGRTMNDAISQFRLCWDYEIIAITELDDSINSNCL